MTIRTLIMLSSVCVLSIAAQSQDKVEEKPKFGYFQCRADAQKWTYDPFDKSLDAKYLTGDAIMVNGQFRVLPHLSYGVTSAVLIQRIYESDVCTREDAEFEKQFVTYSRLMQSYRDERTFRYMHFLMNHHLLDQFTKEDTEEFK